MNVQSYFVAKFIGIEELKFSKKHVNEKQIRRNARSLDVEALNQEDS